MTSLRKRYNCPVELALEFVGGRWKVVILAWLKERPLRYAELRARVPGISDKVLSARLKDLEAFGLVAKVPGPGHASVYALTPRGEGLRPMLDALYAWGAAMAQEMSLDIEGGPAPWVGQ